MEQWVDENKEKSMGDTIATLLKEYQMGSCHSHNFLCGGMFIRNIVEIVENVAMRDNKNRILVHSMQQILRKGRLGWHHLYICWS
jgi:hypothetical protein